ncbi:MAG: hypothetical protein ABI818_14935 [Acidobacteriota bacterium]
MLVVSPFVAYAIWRAVEERRLDRAFDAIEARGEWLDTASFELHPSTAEQRQASHYYAQAMDQVGDDWPPFRTAAKTIEELCVSSVGDSSRAAALAALRPLEDHYGAALALLDRATPPDAWGWDAGDQPRDWGIWAALASPFGVHAGPRYLAQAAPLAAETLARTRASIAALPATLADLVPAYLEAPLLDPFTAAPLVYRPDGKRYKVYSVGFNRKDDGGAWDSPSDLQTGRRGNPLDVGISGGAAAVTR